MDDTGTAPDRPPRPLHPRAPFPHLVPLLRATALEAAILAGHLLLYPSGLLPERRPGALHADAARRTAPDTTLPSLPRSSSPPVVLLHGFVDNRSAFVLLRRSLARSGHRRIESLNYSPLTCDIRVAAELLGRHVEDLLARTGQGHVDVVGHSLGGLIARYYVQRLGGDLRVRTLVTLGTPHSGTRVAPLADAHPIVRQMRPHSAVLEELRRPAPGCRTRFVSFWSDLDRLMVPVETACIDHPDLTAQNVRVTGIGHLALPVHPAVAARVWQALDAGLTEPGDGTARPSGRAQDRTEVGGLTVA
ncbi:triacylglycerol lipase [Streptomyces sp. B3I8]|uniref:esterase/lipase family protein n=1 Tax=Streptomyces sp. B3I8 TaxID=3042303 RepID=UPI002785A0DD|nr:alpha/beta fold hydrolase [Streptomyces sp. B3I8]MDQ0788703.1 pimeloyl-ACP methyl ester carboxylesterase [Streptomyces sp. B3I8]